MKKTLGAIVLSLMACATPVKQVEPIKEMTIMGAYDQERLSQKDYVPIKQAYKMVTPHIAVIKSGNYMNDGYDGLSKFCFYMIDMKNGFKSYISVDRKPVDKVENKGLKSFGYESRTELDKDGGVETMVNKCKKSMYGKGV